MKVYIALHHRLVQGLRVDQGGGEVVETTIIDVYSTPLQADLAIEGVKEDELRQYHADSKAIGERPKPWEYYDEGYTTFEVDVRELK